MHTLDGSSPLPPTWRGGIVALGNFDGVHLGHQAVIGRAFDLARREGRPALVATFDPHPVRYFSADAPPFRLTTVPQRARLLADVGVDGMVVLPFDAALAALDPTDFFAAILVARLGIAGLVTGEDFRFGRGRGGDVALLRRLGGAQDVVVDAETAILLGGEPVSSTRIRHAVAAGDMVAAADLLSRPFSISGVAVSEDGFAALDTGDYVAPAVGEYRARVTVGEETWRGIVPSRPHGDRSILHLPARFGGRTVLAELLRTNVPRGGGAVPACDDS